MLFNSLEFLIFLPLVFAIHWALPSRLQNGFLLGASYFFYGAWDWRCLGLLLAISQINFWTGLKLQNLKNSGRRLLILRLCLLGNISILAFFKYYNFFTDSFVQTFRFFGFSMESPHLNIVLPLGISYYTLQGLGYSLDVYWGRIEATEDRWSFYTFLAFFPQLLAGPIERAGQLLPQFQKPRFFCSEQARDGLRQMLWGFFKKLVVADACGEFVDRIFSNHSSAAGGLLALALFLFAFQIYGDFSGYSDIAIGAASLLGIRLAPNFRTPYFARDIVEFWQRWHISLTTWLREFVYYPLVLSGSRGQMRQAINVIVLFLLTGLWHGAKWTYVLWGLLQGLLLLPATLFPRRRKQRKTKVIAQGRFGPTMAELGALVWTFSLTLLSFLFVRAESVPQAFDYLFRLVSWQNGFSFKQPIILGITLFWISLLLVVEWFNREHDHGLGGLANRPRWFRWLCYNVLLMSIIFGGVHDQTEFIYFQF